MKATLTKIDPLKESRNKKQSYIRLYFTMEDKTWACTDVVPGYRNFKIWKPVILSGVGTIIEGMFMKGKGKIDADSPIKIIGKESKQATLWQ